MARTGRPKVKIDKKLFETLCGMQCTEKEICACFECCEDTLNSWCKATYKDEDGKPLTFSDVFKQKREKGRISLRRSQWRLAASNSRMAIWLGKQYLGQTDARAVTFNGADEDDPLTKALKETAAELDQDGGENGA